MKIIDDQNLAPPNGHYSPGILHNNFVFTSGQLGVSDSTGLIPESFSDEVEICLNNVFKILDVAGSSKDKIVKITIYLSDISLWEAANSVFENLLGEHKPARSVIGGVSIHRRARIVAEAIAFI